MNKFAWLTIFIMFLSSPSFAGVVKKPIKKALKSSVAISVKKQGSGSGFAIHRDKERNRTLIATNDHVCQMTRGKVFLSGQIDYMANLNKFPMMIIDYHDNRYKGTVMYVSNVHLATKNDPRDDLCIVEIEEELPTIKLSDSKAKIGEEVFNVSAPRGFFPVVHAGYGGPTYNNNPRSNSVQVYTLYLNSGSSGSAVFNMEGEAVAVVFAIDLAEAGLRVPIVTYAIPIEHLKQFKNEYYRALKEK